LEETPARPLADSYPEPIEGSGVEDGEKSSALDGLGRGGLTIAVLAAENSQREILTRFFREAGYGTVHSAPADPSSFSRLAESGVARADLVALAIPQKISAETWGLLRAARSRLGALVIVLAEMRSREVLQRAFHLGAAECLAGGRPLDLALLGLQAEKVLMAGAYGATIEADKRRTRSLFVNVLSVLARVLESKDSYTRFHSHNVAKWSRAVGRRRGLGENELDRLGLAAVLHDLGKVGVPEAVLNKPAGLSDEEKALIGKHPVIAAEILEPLGAMADIVPAILHHHERWDGDGYPGKLDGVLTPLWARIIGIADAYDTMVSARTYKEPYPKEKVRAELEQGRGTQFDPELADILLAIMDEEQPSD